jgi:hypothetical protein
MRAIDVLVVVNLMLAQLPPEEPRLRQIPGTWAEPS